MKIYFLFLCLIAHVLYGSEPYFLKNELTNRSSVRFYFLYDPAKARRLIADNMKNPDLLPAIDYSISRAEEGLNEYEEAGCWGKMYPYVRKTAYGMGALGIVLDVTIVATKGATNPWMFASFPLLAPVVGRFCFHQYYIKQAKDLIRFMKQTQAELQTPQVQPEELREQTESSAIPSKKKVRQYSCSIL